MPDSDIAALYSGLLPDEVRHHRVYLELAEEIVAAAAARERFRELAEWEVRVLNESPALPRMHT